MDWGAVSALCAITVVLLSMGAGLIKIGGLAAQSREAKAMATNAQKTADSAVADLAAYKAVVAKEYASHEAMSDMEDKLSNAIGKIGDRLDEGFNRLADRLDRVVDGRTHAGRAQAH